MKNSDKILYKKAKKIVIENNNASISFVQRKLMIGYERARVLIQELERRGIVLLKNPNEVKRVVSVKRFKRDKWFKSKYKNKRVRLTKYHFIK